MLNKKEFTKQEVNNMPFLQISLKMKIAAISPRFGRYDSKLKVKLLYKRTFDNWQFGQYMYFGVAIFKLGKSKSHEKNCKFETLYVEKYKSQECEFLRDKRP